jgi:hypothetical protein
LSAEVYAYRILEYKKSISIAGLHACVCFSRLASHTSCMAGHLSLMEGDEVLFEFSKFIAINSHFSNILNL